MDWLSRCCIRPPATRDDDVTRHDVAPAIVPSAPRVDAAHQQPPTELDSSVDWASFPHEIKVAILAQLLPTTLLQMRPPSGTLAAACVRAGIYDIPPGPEGDGRARAALALRAGVGTWGCGTPKEIFVPASPEMVMFSTATFGDRHIAAVSGEKDADGNYNKTIWLFDRRTAAWQPLPTTLNVHGSCMAFGPNRLFARDHDHLEAYDLTAEGAVHRLWRAPLQTHAYRDLVYGPSGQTFSFSRHDPNQPSAPVVFGWDAACGRSVAVNCSTVGYANLTTLAAGPDALVALTETPELLVWPYELLHMPPRRIPLPPVDVNSVHVTADGILLSGSGRTVVRLAPLAEGAREVCRWTDPFSFCSDGVIIGDHALWAAPANRRIMRAATGGAATPLLTLPFDEESEGWWTVWREVDEIIRSFPDVSAETLSKPLFVPSAGNTWRVVGSALVGSLGLHGNGFCEADYVAVPLRAT